MRKKRKLSEEHKRKISESQKGMKKHFSKEAIENIRKAAAKRKGIPTGPCSEETKEKIRLATTGKSKTIVNDNPSWFKKGHQPEKGFTKGHVPWNKGKSWGTDIIEKLAAARRGTGKGRNCWNNKQWRKAVRERDNYECKGCFSKDRLHSHHIKSWEEYPDLRFEIDNGLTLCISCHARLHGKDMCNIIKAVIV